MLSRSRRPRAAQPTTPCSTASSRVPCCTAARLAPASQASPIQPFRSHPGHASRSERRARRSRSRSSRATSRRTARAAARPRRRTSACAPRLTQPSLAIASRCCPARTRLCRYSTCAAPGSARWSSLLPGWPCQKKTAMAKKSGLTPRRARCRPRPHPRAPAALVKATTPIPAHPLLPSPARWPSQVRPATGRPRSVWLGARTCGSAVSGWSAPPSA
mmetsp:Transcript_43817/g.135277  ORF Transcript_43817/g.135277 Transcript_43817/m.135277 type:complete len:217 (+) Transcript_43817:588-1238(+)